MATEGTFQPCIDAAEKGEDSTDRTPLLSRNNRRLSNDAEEPDNIPEEKKKTSDAGTLLHIVKGNVGTGILAMALALSNAGLVAGAISICVLGFCCTYCMKLLVYCSRVAVEQKQTLEQQNEAAPPVANPSVQKQTLEQQNEAAPPVANPSVGVDRLVSFFPNRNNSDGPGTGYQRAGQREQVDNRCNENQVLEENMSMDYASTAHEAFLHGPQCCKKLATPMKYIVNGLLILTQFGFCCVYLLFVGQSLREVFRNTEFLTSLSTTSILAMELLIMIPLNFIPDLRALAVVSAVAVCLQGVGLIVVLADVFRGPMSDSYTLYFAPVSKWPLFFGTAMFSFEGIGVILPLEMAMKNPRNFPRILYGGMTIVAGMYLVIGVGGYLKYGTDVKPSITFNLPPGWVSELIRSLFAVAIFLSYPLQMYVPLSFTMPYLKGRFLPERCDRRFERAVDWLIRAFFVLITFVVAVSVPMLDLIIALIGSFASSGLALILPPLIHLVTMYRCGDIKYGQAGFDVFLSGLGLLGLGAGAYTSISEMLNRNATDAAFTVASYNGLMSPGTDEDVLFQISSNSSCCTFFH